MKVTSTQNNYGETYRLVVDGESLRRLNSGRFEADLGKIAGIGLKDLPRDARIKLRYLDEDAATVYAGGIQAVDDNKAMVTAYYDQCPLKLKSGISYEAHVNVAERMVKSKIANDAVAQCNGILHDDDTDHLAVECVITVDAVDIGEACEKAVAWFQDIEAKLADLSMAVDHLIHNAVL